MYFKIRVFWVVNDVSTLIVTNVSGMHIVSIFRVQHYLTAIFVVLRVVLVMIQVLWRLVNTSDYLPVNMSYPRRPVSPV
jgi:hypothetical protein